MPGTRFTIGGTVAASRLLLVEDEFLIRLTLSETLIDDGFEVVEAEDGGAALALLAQQQEIALMLTDIQLPGGLDGHALAAKVRSLRPGLPVIFMSGRPAGAPPTSRLDTYVSKPYSPAAVSATVRRILQGA